MYRQAIKSTVTRFSTRTALRSIRARPYSSESSGSTGSKTSWIINVAPTAITTVAALYFFQAPSHETSHDHSLKEEAEKKVEEAKEAAEPIIDDAKETVSETAEQAKESSEPVIEALTEKANAAADNIKEVSESAVKDTSDKVENVIEEAKEKAEPVAEKVSEKIEDATEEVKKTVEPVTEQVSEKIEAATDSDPLSESSKESIDLLSKDLEQAIEENAIPADAPVESSEQTENQGAFNPETGEINWDCPCLGGMANGPCGEEFKTAFSCFVYSEAEPKGMECIEKFSAMQDCFRKHPDVYSEELQEAEPFPEDNAQTQETKTTEKQD